MPVARTSDMNENNSKNRYGLKLPKFINPAFVQNIQQGTAKGIVQEGAVEAGGDLYQIKGHECPEDGTEVIIRDGDNGLYCETVEQVEQEKAERQRDRHEKERQREHEQARKQDRRRAEALQFWEGYDIPFEYDVRIKVRLSGLTRGSNGTGRAKDTVEHLYVREGFEEGRLSRSADRYLCDDDAHIRDEESEVAADSNGNSYEKPVTCKACLNLMERWERGHEE